MGTGIARGFLAALDSSWMISRWAQGAEPLEVLAESINTQYEYKYPVPTERVCTASSLRRLLKTFRGISEPVLHRPPDQVPDPQAEGHRT
ncbi:hypothetical protein KUCAC02_034085 [Chaenocephalus aceratus]|nr:hypothetical protein KUCAC02_034085 [Chaenocephalus aceratus]